MSDKTSHREILKSTSIIGGSSVVVMLLNIVRIRVVSHLLGPSGYGIFGLFSTLILLMVTFSGLGIGNSGVRQIAELPARRMLPESPRQSLLCGAWRSSRASLGPF